MRKNIIFKDWVKTIIWAKEVRVKEGWQQSKCLIFTDMSIPITLILTGLIVDEYSILKQRNILNQEISSFEPFRFKFTYFAICSKRIIRKHEFKWTRSFLTLFVSGGGIHQAGKLLPISQRKIYEILWYFLTFNKILLATSIPIFMIIDPVDQVL